MTQTRLQTSEFVEHNLDDVVYVHINCFILFIYLYEEEYSDCKITNCNGC